MPVSRGVIRDIGSAEGTRGRVVVVVDEEDDGSRGFRCHRRGGYGEGIYMVRGDGGVGR